MSKARQAADEVNRQQAGRRNLIINGAMQVAQRGTSSTSINFGSVDRFKWNQISGGTAAITQSQSTDAPDGFANSWKLLLTTADADTSYVFAQYNVEAQDLQRLAYGTSSAKSLTLSFWVKSSVTGDYAINMYMPDPYRSITPTYTINSADTWEYKTITIAGDTGGAGPNNDNGIGLSLYFILDQSGYDGTDGSAWGAYTAQKFAWGHTANWAATANNEFYITGVQLEVGDVATPFEHRSYGEELALCQRYYQHVDLANGNEFSGLIDGYYSTNNYLTHYVSFNVTMRTTPTMSNLTNGTTSNANNLGITSHSPFGALFSGRCVATGRSYIYFNSADADAEL